LGKKRQFRAKTDGPFRSTGRKGDLNTTKTRFTRSSLKVRNTMQALYLSIIEVNHTELPRGAAKFYMPPKK